jgi:hypothetical protein
VLWQHLIKQFCNIFVFNFTLSTNTQLLNIKHYSNVYGESKQIISVPVLAFDVFRTNKCKNVNNNIMN